MCMKLKDLEKKTVGLKINCEKAVTGDKCGM
jgi:hypothetical protein